MAQWYQFYHTEDDAEILVGLYDRWLSQLGFGPTQAERCLLHTEMTEVAHERRFLIAQTSSDMSGFEVDHSRRVTEAIDHLERNFISRADQKVRSIEPRSQTRHRSSSSSSSASSGTRIEEASRIQEDAVVQMMAWADHDTPTESLQDYFDDRRASMRLPPRQLSLNSGTSAVSSPIPRPSVRPGTNVEPEIDIDDTTSDGFMEEQYRAVLTKLVSTSLPNKRRYGSSDSPQTIKEIRVRKKTKLPHHHCPQPTGHSTAHNTTNMSLDVMLN